MGLRKRFIYPQPPTTEGNVMGIISDSPTMKAPKQTSAQQNTSVGGGSRPTASKIKTETSAPSNAATLDRTPPSGLK